MEQRMFDCARRGDLSNLMLLVESRGNVNARDANKFTLLHTAVMNRQTACVKYVLEIAPHLALLKNDAGRIPLHCACHPILGNDMIRLLVAIRDSLEIENDDEQRTPLHLVSSNNEGLEVMRILLDSGASVNSVDCKQRTVLRSTITSGNHEMVQLVLDRGASPTVGDFMTVNIRSHWLVMGVLLNHSPHQIDCSDSEGYTLLMRVAHYGTVIHLRQLLALGANPNMRSRGGTTPLQEAILSLDVEMVDALLEYGADPTVDLMNGFTVLSTICRMPHDPSRIFNLLIAHPSIVDPNFQFRSVRMHPLRVALYHKQSAELLEAILNSRFSDPTLTFGSEYCSGDDNVLSYFDNITFSPTSYLLHNPEGVLTANQTMYSMLELLLDDGYPIGSVNGTIPPLTVLLSCNAEMITDTDMFNKIFHLLIERGAPVHDISLPLMNCDAQFWINVAYLREHTRLPDALLMAVMCRHMDLVDELLLYWCAPPLAVLLLVDTLQPHEIFQLFYKLAKHGIPIGTEIYQKLIQWLPQISSIRNRQSSFDYLSLMMDDLRRFASQPRSLQEMCKYSAREALTRVAIYNETTLPLEIQIEAPFALQKYLLMDVPEDCVPEMPYVPRHRCLINPPFSFPH